MAFDTSKIVIPQSVLQRGLRPETQYSVDVLNDAIKNIPTKYTEFQGQAKAKSKLGLTGLGNYEYGDDPSTPDKEGADHIYRKDKQIGDREVGAVHNEDNKANSRGLLSSSFRDRNVGDALGRLNREAQQVMSDYSGQMKTLFQQERDETVDLNTKLQATYVGESDWLRDNPPKPPDPPPDPAPAPQSNVDPAASPQKQYAQEQGWLGPWAAKPAPNPNLTYFLRQPPGGGKSYWYAVPKNR